MNMEFSMVSLLGKSDAGVVQGSFPLIPNKEAVYSKNICMSKQLILSGT